MRTTARHFLTRFWGVLMIRRIFVAVLSLLLLLYLLSCKNNEPEYLITLPAADFTVTSLEERFTDYYNDVSLLYPVISGYVDPAAEADINEQMRDKVMAEYTSAALASDEEVSYTYQITEIRVMLMTEGFCSMVVLGQYIGTDASHVEYVSYTINADLVSSRLLSTYDLITDDASLRKMFTDGKFALAYGSADLLKDMPLDEMLLPYRAEYGIYPDVFFTEGRVGIHVELPHVLGGYAGYTLNILSAGDVLRPGRIGTLLTTDVSGAETKN